jgi:hypothetical protein
MQDRIPFVLVTVSGGIAEVMTPLEDAARVLTFQIDWDSINDGGISDDDLDSMIMEAEAGPLAAWRPDIVADLREAKGVREARLRQDEQEERERRQREIDHARAVLVEAGEL